MLSPHTKAGALPFSRSVREGGAWLTSRWRTIRYAPTSVVYATLSGQGWSQSNAACQLGVLVEFTYCGEPRHSFVG